MSRAFEPRLVRKRKIRSKASKTPYKTWGFRLAGGHSATGKGDPQGFCHDPEVADRDPQVTEGDP
jgi:hypothetical protein